MCGICGVFEYGTSSRVDRSLLVAMSDTIAHRGPDDAGVFVDERDRVGFGFRRLSIVDLSSAAHQPMQTPDGAVTIVFNGEIYNHAVLRPALEKKGYRYRSRSDTETILYLYLEHGLDFVHKLLGMFAIAIWDSTRRRLVLARDRIGVKPLYYYDKDGRFLFASEIKAILRHPSVSTVFNDRALETYLTFLTPPAPTTLFRDVRKLEPGRLMVVTANGITDIDRYWHVLGGINQPSISLDGEPSSASPLAELAVHQSEDEVVETVRTLLRTSIRDRMMSDVPFGVFLSGGIDSTTNVALMAGLMSRPVDTFSVGFRDLEAYNELGYARQAAKAFGANHHEIIIGEKEAFAFLPELVWHQDEPLADPVCIPLYFVSKCARDNGTIVVQVGEGSDEQFAGYGWLQRELRFHDTAWRAFGLVPAPVRRLSYAAVRGLVRSGGALLALDYLRRGAESDELFWGGAVNLTEEHKRRLLHRRGDVDAAADHVREWHEEARSWLGKNDYLGEMTYLEFRHRLPELLLMRVDKLSMATSVEARVPFLDHRLVEYSMRIPRRMKLHRGETKYIFKRAVAGLIPDEIIRRPKQGFAAPVQEWLRTAWRPFVEEMLLSSDFVREGVYDRAFVERLLRMHASDRRTEGQNVWNLLNLELWYRRYFKGGW